MERMKILISSAILAVCLLPAPLFAQGWECDSGAATTPCTATLILADGTQVPVSLQGGNELHRGEGVTVLLTSNNWKRLPQ